MNDTAPTPQHATVNGLKLHYEIHGQGRPLVLLHGGIAASEAFGPNLAALARGRRVIAVHLQGHGHTPDIDRPLRFESMADDIAGLLRHLRLDQADVLGYSLGGGVALQLAIRHPAQVGRLIVVSQTMARAGWYPEVQAAFEGMGAMAPQIAQNLKRSPLAAMYPQVDWEKLFRKMGELESRDFDWSRQVAAITAPTLLVFADADAIRLEHIAQFYQQLGGGRRDAGQDGSLRTPNRLAIVPGATHYDILSTTAVSTLAAGFLDAGRAA